MKKIFKKIKKYLTNKYVKAVLYYTKYYDKISKLKENEILLQSYDGSSISGNPYYLLIELCNNEEYREFKKYVASNSKNIKAIKNIIKKEKLHNTEAVLIHSRKYCKKLAEVKYLINNSTFATYFIKKEGQIYLNTWHGTPLKAMGRDIIETPHELGNTQRNFLMSDYLLYQNESMFNTMKNGYMLDNIYTGKYVISGYPRNDIFFSEESRENIRRELGLENKKVIVYMPTWRGTITCKQNDEQAEKITEMMDALQENLQEDTIVYCKIHNLASTKIDYEKYKNIREFPKNYETYSVLNISDCLITDYSSVMIDYANLNKKIILYTYDYDEYTKDRGFYIDVKDTPFEIVNTIEELIEEVKDLDKKSDYSKFIEEYCNYDSKDISKKICKLLLKNDSTDLKVIDGNKIKNQKENILIFTGALLKNGITTALKGLINNIDLKEYNYYLTFSRKAVNGNSRVISSFPKECNYIPIQGQKDYRFIERNSKLSIF